MNHSFENLDSAILDSGLKVLSLDAGRSLSALFQEDEIHAAYLARDDIAALDPGEQAVRWEQQKRGIAAFMQLFAGAKLYGS